MSACDDTDDKVFLPSYSEYNAQSGSFRACKPTDYAKAQALEYNVDSGNGWYWTRSPDGGYQNNQRASFISGYGSSGGFGCAGILTATFGVRPAITVKFN